MEKEAFLTVNQFISIILPLLGGMLIVAYVLITKVNHLKTDLTNQGEHLKDAKIDIGELQKEQRNLLAMRNKDLLDFTEILGRINITLGRFDVTLKTIDEGFREVKEMYKDITKKN
jgi:hypothetical protein